VNFYFVDTHVNVTYTTISQLLQVLSTQQWLRWVTVWAQTWAENSGGGLRLFGGRAGSPSNTMWPGPRSTFVSSDILIHPAVWPQQIWTENWGAVPFFGGAGAGFPYNTVSPGPRPTSLPLGRGSCVPSFILIHPTVWPQYTNVTDRQDRQTTVS